MHRTRREVLAITAAGGLAGCLSEGDAAAYEARLAEKNAKMQEQNETIAELEEELEAKRVTTDELVVHVDERDEQLASLKEEMAYKREELQKINDEYDTSQAEIERLEAELATLEETIDDLTPASEFTDEQIQIAGEVGHTKRTAVPVLWDSVSLAAGYHTGGGDYLTVAHALTPDTTIWGPWAETLRGEQFEVTREDQEFGLDLRYVTGITNVPSIDITDWATPSNGDPVVLVGHPNNVGEWVISMGSYVETRSTDIVDSDHIVVNAPGTRGNSGGPAFTMNGEFVGMVTHTKWTWEGYDAPAKVFHSFAEYEPWLGIVPAPDIVEQAEAWGVV